MTKLIDLIPVAYINDTPTAWLAAFSNGECVIISEKTKRVHEGRPECSAH